ERCQNTIVTSTDPTKTGALTNELWQARLFDEATGMSAGVCSQLTPLHVSCAIPPRPAGSAAHAYRVGTYVDSGAELFFTEPVGTVFKETSVVGIAYTGLDPVSVGHCNALQKMVVNSMLTKYTCAYGIYAHFKALETARIDFAPFQVQHQASIGPSVAL